MKCRSLSKLVACAALLVTPMAMSATPIDGWYGGLFGGYAYLPNNIGTTHFNLIRTDGSYKSAYDAGGSFGYKSNPLRYEGELTYIDAKLSRFNINNVRQTGVRGYTHAAFGMANIYYDFPVIISPLQPYLGVGIGYGWIKAKLESSGPLFVSSYSNSDSVFAYQAMGGITYDFAENYALTLSYRYIGTDRVDGLGRVYQAHLGNVGLVYRFCDNNYK